MKPTQIVLLNYNSFQDTFECIQSILDSGEREYGIIVVDNDSKDDSFLKLQEYYGEIDTIHFIKSDENLGFSGGCNIGIDYALKNGADYVLLLNNDTIVTPNFLNALLAVFKLNENIGVAGGKTFFHEEREAIWDAGGFISNTKFMGVRRNENSLGIDEIGEVGFITGCLALIKREVFDTIGMLPEAYFFGSEEWEFSLRANRAGYKLIYTPECVIYHKVGRAHDYQSPMMLYNTYRNRILFVKRNYSFLKYFLFAHVFLGIKFFQKVLGIGQLKRFPFGKALFLLKESYFDSFKYSSVLKKHLEKF